MSHLLLWDNAYAQIIRNGKGEIGVSQNLCKPSNGCKIDLPIWRFILWQKKDTPQKAALREMMGNYLKEKQCKSQGRNRCQFHYA